MLRRMVPTETLRARLAEVGVPVEFDGHPTYPVARRHVLARPGATAPANGNGPGRLRLDGPLLRSRAVGVERIRRQTETGLILAVFQN